MSSEVGPEVADESPAPNREGVPEKGGTVSRRRHRAVLLAVAGGVATFAVIALGLWFSGGDDPSTSYEPPDRIVAVHPPPGSPAVLRQESVGVTAEPGWDCRLTVDGDLVPEDEMEPTGGLGRCYFRPGEDKTIEAWAPGPHAVSVSLVNVEDENQTLTWTFTFTSS